MLSVLDVMNTCKDYVRPLREVEDLYNNGLLICAGITKKSGLIVECQGLATEVSHVHKHPHIIDVKIDLHKAAGERIIEGKCSCIAGESSKCKHYVALLLHLSRTNEDELDDLSCTDIEQQWGKIKTSHHKEYEGRRISELCHVKSQRDVYTTQTLEITPEMREKWKKHFDTLQVFIIFYSFWIICFMYYFILANMIG